LRQIKKTDTVAGLRWLSVRESGAGLQGKAMLLIETLFPVVPERRRRGLTTTGGRVTTPRSGPGDAAFAACTGAANV